MLLNLDTVLASLNLVSSVNKPFTLGGRLSGLSNPLGSTESSLMPFFGISVTPDGFQTAANGTSTNSTVKIDQPQADLLASLIEVTQSGSLNDTSVLQALNRTLQTFNSSLPANITATDLSAVLTALISGTFAASGVDCGNIPDYNAPDVVVEPFAPYDAAKALIFRYRQQQSVNLGSWFVHEAWMNPGMAACSSGLQQSELDIAWGWGGFDKAKMVLEKHWDTWITEDDFAYLASIGINTVRIPIGYWTLGPDFTQGTDFEPVGATVYSNSYPRLLRAIKWAEKYDLGVLVDMHGAVGGQNRETHSGVSGGTLGLFKDPYNMEKTIVALEYLTKQLINVNNIVGIEILNEPVDDPGLIPFYEHALDRLRSLSPEAGMFPFYYHNAFNTTKYSAWQAPRTDFLVQDEHSYFLFDEANKAKSMAQLDTEIKQTSGSLSQLYINSANSVRRNMVIDEWSCGLSDNALMGVQDQEAARRAFCTGQMQTYANTTAGYAFWAYKTEYCEGDPNWCFRGRVGVSLPATFYSYPNGSALANSSMINSASSDNSSEVSFFSIGADFASMTGLSEADSAMLLLATSTSADAVNFAMINEILATTDFDMEFFPEIFRTNGSFSDDPAPIVSNPPNISSPAEQSTEAVAALPAQVIPPSAAYLINPPPNMKGFYQHKISRRHRFERLNRNRHLDTRADSAAASAELSPTEAALARGYADGVKAAKSFALFHGSRLGFTGQFIQDALNGNKNIDGDEGKQAYQGGFMTGLAEGEASVLSGLANGTSS